MISFPLDLQAFCIFDLEYTCWKGSCQREWSGPNEFREVVCIGAIRIQRTGNSLQETDSFLRFVKPKLNDNLSPYFQSLTGISTQEVLDLGVDYRMGLQELNEFARGIPCFCYGLDGFVLIENLLLYKIAHSFESLSGIKVGLSLSKTERQDTLLAVDRLQTVYAYGTASQATMEALAAKGLVISLASPILIPSPAHNLKTFNMRPWIHQVMPQAVGHSSGELSKLVGQSVNMSAKAHNPLYDTRSLLLTLQSLDGHIDM